MSRALAAFAADRRNKFDFTGQLPKMQFFRVGKQPGAGGDPNFHSVDLTFPVKYPGYGIPAKLKKCGVVFLLLPVYVNARSGTRKQKFQPVIVNFVHHNPIVGNMTASITTPFSFEWVVAMPRFKRSLL